MGSRASPAAGRAAAWIVIAAIAVGACTQSDEKPRAERPRIEPARTVPSIDARWFKRSCDLPVEYLRRIKRGYFPDHSPDVAVVPKEPNYFGAFDSTSHSGPWEYLQNVPLVLYGPGYVRAQGAIEPNATVADLAPTFAELLGTPWPDDRPGRVLSEALLPEDERNGTPRLLVTIVWDGGGWNVLNRWPDSWPHLASVIERGTSFTNATVGSSPSVTPSVHATIGAGAFPDQHGIVDIPLRDGDRIVGSWEGRSPKYMELTSLADLYDPTTDNKAVVGMVGGHNWHLGMIGHGDFIPGGDRDVAMVVNAQQLDMNRDYWSLPSYLQDVSALRDYLRRVDIEDGRADQRWRGNEVLDVLSEARHTPAGVLHQTKVIKALVDGEDFGRDDVGDLLYINYKQVDWVGHDFNMVRPEMREIVRYTDDALKELTAYLDERVGADRWVLAVTADHGSTPAARSTGSWPISMANLTADAAGHFGVGPELLQEERVTGFWLDRDVMKPNGITAEDVSEFVLNYELGDNIADGEPVPAGYDERVHERLFAAAFPMTKLRRILRCATAG
ncbi:MAG: alkaline phosphatase family protein [Actinomycetota bacterium]